MEPLENAVTTRSRWLAAAVPMRAMNRAISVNEVTTMIDNAVGMPNRAKLVNVGQCGGSMRCPGQGAVHRFGPQQPQRHGQHDRTTHKVVRTTCYTQ